MQKSTNEAIRRRVLVGALSNYAGQIVAFATLFFLTPFILRELGPTAYGLWVLVGSLMSYGALLDFGVWGALIKYVAEFEARGQSELARSLLVTALWLYVGLAILLVLFSIGLAATFSRWFTLAPELRRVAPMLVVLMGVGAGIAMPAMSPMAILRGLQRYDIVNLVEVAGTLFTAGLTVLALSLGGGLLALVAVNIGGTLFVMALAVYWIRRLAPELRIPWRQFGWHNVEGQVARRIIAYSWPLFVSDISYRLQSKTDEIVIGFFLLIRSVTPYNLAKKLSDVTQILTKQFMKVFLPLASELSADEDHGRLRALYATGLRLTVAIALLFSAIFILFARPILTLWVGEEYATASNIVVILTLAGLMSAIQGPAVVVLRGMSRHRPLAAIALASGIANLILSIVLARRWQIEGVAMGTLIPSVVELIIVLAYVTHVLAQDRRQLLFRAFAPALLALLPMVLVTLSLSQLWSLAAFFPLAVTVSAAGMAYVGVYWLIGLNGRERQSYLHSVQELLASVGTRLQRARA